MKIAGRDIIQFEFPIYVQKVEEHHLQKDDFLKLMKEEKPWWEIFVLTHDKYTKNVMNYFESKWTNYVKFWTDDYKLGKSEIRHSHYTFLYFWHDNKLTLTLNGKEKIIDVVEGSLISFPSLMRYSIKNDKVTGYDVTFNN